MRVAITGAAGFVGRALGVRCTELGWTVHGFDLGSALNRAALNRAALNRAALNRAALNRAGPGPEQLRPWDVGAAPLSRAPEVDVVLHTAARLGPAEPLAAARRVNVTGTQNVVTSFPGARLVHLSSCSVYDPWQAQVEAAEDEAPDPDSIRWTNAYGRTKSEAERWLARERPDAVRLRPHAVYGDGDTTLVPRIRAAVRHGSLPLPGPGTQLHSITWVQNLVQACLLACAADAPGGAYNITDQDPVLLMDALAAIATPPGGTRPRIRPMPVRLLLPVALAHEALARARTAVTGHDHEPRVNLYNVEHLARNRTFDITKARDLLGYSPAPSTLVESTLS